MRPCCMNSIARRAPRRSRPPELSWPGKAGGGGRRASNGDDARDIATSHWFLLPAVSTGRRTALALGVDSAPSKLGTRAQRAGRLGRRHGPPLRESVAGLEGGDGG